MPKKKCPPPAASWLATFSDLMSLLLTFFILLLSFAEMDVQKFKEMSGKLEKAFGVQRNDPVKDIPKGMDMIARDFNPQFVQELLLKRIKSALKTIEKGKIEVLQDMRGIVLRISDENFFDSGRATLRPNAWPVLDSIIEIAKTVQNDISIEAHTDTEEYKEDKKKGFRDSWELSAARAVTVARYFDEFGGIDRNRIVPTARGDSVPVASNDDASGRIKNRRLEIVFLRKIDVEEQVVDKMFSPTEKAGKSDDYDINIFNLGN